MSEAKRKEPEEPLAVRREQAARLLNVSEALLRKWEHAGKGPRFRREGRAVLYPMQSLRRFAEGE